MMAEGLDPIDHKRLEDWLWAWEHEDPACVWRHYPPLAVAEQERRCVCPDSEEFFAYLNSKFKPT
jgi:hypothetical protein